MINDIINKGDLFMNGSRGAKGSVNDRVISMLYRKRYFEYMKKLQSYNKADRQKQKEYLEKIKVFDIDTGMPSLDPEDKDVLQQAFKPLENITILKGHTSPEVSVPNVTTTSTLTDEQIDSLINIGTKIEEYDPQKENYDLDNYDYYEILSTKTGLSSVAPDEIIDVEREIEKKDDEIVIIEEVTEFIDESKELLSEIKFSLNDIKESLQEQYTIDQLQALDEKYQVVRTKILELKSKYLVISEKYNFEDFQILDNIKLLEAVEDYKDKASLEELEMLVEVCKNEVDEIDGILIEEKKRIGIDSEFNQREKEIKNRDIAFDNTKSQTIHYTELEKIIGTEARKQQEMIKEIDERMSKVKTEVERTTEYVYHTGKMFSSFLKITAGILTAPFSGINIFGIMIGTRLINRGLKDLRKSIVPTEVEKTKVVEKFENVEREILNTKDSVATTFKLIDDSLSQVESIKEDFKTRFSPYSLYIPEYSKVYNMLETLEQNLNTKKEQIKRMQKTLDRQYEKNKQKVLKAS